MRVDQLMELRNSNESPFDHIDYTIWLHNKIVEDVRYELLQHRESSREDASKFMHCNEILNFESLKPIQ